MQTGRVVSCAHETLLTGTERATFNSVYSTSVLLEYITPDWHDLRHTFPCSDERIPVMLMRRLQGSFNPIDTVFRYIIKNKWYTAGNLLIQLSNNQPHYSVLGNACMDGNFNLVVTLLKCGVDVHMCGDIALSWAVRYNRRKIIHYLLTTYKFCNKTLNNCIRNAMVNQSHDIRDLLIQNSRSQ